MYNIDNSELLRLCQGLTESLPPFYTIQQTFACDLYTTGVRPSELLQLSRWSPSGLGSQYWQLQPQKGNTPRQIAKAALSDHLNFCIINNVKPYNGLSLRQLEFSMKQITPVGRIKVMNKEMVSYIFRYNLVKMLIAAGWDSPEIQVYFGWKNPPFPYYYGSKQLKVTNLNIPAETYTVTSPNCFNIVDADGTNIVSQL